MKKNSEKNSLFKGLMTAYVILFSHIILAAFLGVIVLFFKGFVDYMLWIFIGGIVIILLSLFYFFRRLKREGKNLRDILRTPDFKGKQIEISLLGGLASIKLDNRIQTPELELIAHNAGAPIKQIAEHAPSRTQELTELARLMEKGLINRDEYERAKQDLFE